MGGRRKNHNLSHVHGRRANKRGIKRSTAIPLRSIALSFNLVPESKEPGAPFLKRVPALPDTSRNVVGANKTLSNTSRPRTKVSNEVGSFSPNVAKIRTAKEEMLNISLFSLAVGALRGRALAHFPEPIRCTVGVGKSSFEQEPAGITHPLAVKPGGRFNINITRIMPDSGVTGKFTDNGNTASMTNGVL